MILFFDTETNGLPDFKRPATDPCQPHIVQLGALLYDENRRVVSEINPRVRPDGWTIPLETVKVHGITNEIATKYGLKLSTVMGLLLALAKRATLISVHNFPFDRRMVERALAHLGTAPDEFLAVPSYCTMQHSTNVLKLPGKFGQYKWPTLQEAHTHYLGRPFEGAHDAMADVRALAAVYFAMNPLPQPQPASSN